MLLSATKFKPTGCVDPQLHQQKAARVLAACRTNVRGPIRMAPVLVASLSWIKSSPMALVGPKPALLAKTWTKQQESACPKTTVLRASSKLAIGATSYPTNVSPSTPLPSAINARKNTNLSQGIASSARVRTPTSPARHAPTVTLSGKRGTASQSTPSALPSTREQEGASPASQE